jgi:anti-sigma B factor antagonist
MSLREDETLSAFQLETWPLFQMQTDAGGVLAEARCAEHPGNSGREWLVELGGDLDAFTVPRLRVALSVLTDGGQVIRLDMSEVAFMDSTGAALLIELHQTIDAHGSRLEIIDPSPSVSRVLDILDLGALIEIHEAS